MYFTNDIVRGTLLLYRRSVSRRARTISIAGFHGLEIGELAVIPSLASVITPRFDIEWPKCC